MNIIIHRLTILGIIAFLLAVPIPSIRDEYDTSVLDILPKEFARHLIHSDDSTLTRYCREVGIEYLSRHSFNLKERFRKLPPENNKAKLAAIFHYQLRLATIFKNEFKNNGYLNDYAFLVNQPLERIQEIQNLKSKLGEIYENPSINTEKKIEMTYSILNKLQQYGDTSGVVRAKHKLSELYSEKGDTEKQFILLRDAVAGFEHMGYQRINCQALGVLGILYKNAGNIDSMVICYEKAKKLPSLVV